MWWTFLQNKTERYWKKLHPYDHAWNVEVSSNWTIFCQTFSNVMTRSKAQVYTCDWFKICPCPVIALCGLIAFIGNVICTWRLNWWSTQQQWGIEHLTCDFCRRLFCWQGLAKGQRLPSVFNLPVVRSEHLRKDSFLPWILSLWILILSGSRIENFLLYQLVIK